MLFDSGQDFCNRTLLGGDHLSVVALDDGIIADLLHLLTVLDGIGVGGDHFPTLLAGGDHLIDFGLLEVVIFGQ